MSVLLAIISVDKPAAGAYGFKLNALIKSYVKIIEHLKNIKNKNVQLAANSYCYTAKLSPQLQVRDALGLLKTKPLPFKPPE